MDESPLYLKLIEDYQRAFIIPNNDHIFWDKLSKVLVKVRWPILKVKNNTKWYEILLLLKSVKSLRKMPFNKYNSYLLIRTNFLTKCIIST